jgi:hypothetical protein
MKSHLSMLSLTHKFLKRNRVPDFGFLSIFSSKRKQNCLLGATAGRYKKSPERLTVLQSKEMLKKHDEAAQIPFLT